MKTLKLTNTPAHYQTETACADSRGMSQWQDMSTARGPGWADTLRSNLRKVRRNRDTAARLRVTREDMHASRKATLEAIERRNMQRALEDMREALAGLETAPQAPTPAASPRPARAARSMRVAAMRRRYA